MSKGKCLCGNIQFSVCWGIGEMRYCHRSQCRRVTGSAFSANAKIPNVRFQVVSGQDSIKEFEHKPGIYRAFCSNCGSLIFSRVASDPDSIRVRLGSFESVSDVEITGHVWVSSKATWYSIQDNLSRHAKAIER